MALPGASESCISLDLDLDVIFALAIELPGGVSLQPKFDAGAVVDFSTAAAKLMGEVNAALTPLMPIFRLIDIVLAVFECIKAIPDSLGPPPDPTKLVKCVQKLAKAIDFILKMIPMLSIPVMVKTIIDTVIVALKGLKAQLQNLLTIQVGLDAKLEVVANLQADLDLQAGAAELQLVLDCANADFELVVEATMRSMCPLNSFLGLLDLFLGMIGMGPIGTIELGADLTAALDIIDAAIKLLENIKLALPGLPSIEGC